ncbi:MAG: aminomethyl-transferring glycine dehydrogenase subunit GcvPA [Thermoleophilia bacterium]
MTALDPVHPYMPNSAPAARAEMLAAVGAADAEELYRDIPAHLRLGRPLDLPEALPSELALRRHVTSLLDRNLSSEDAPSFLGGGCWHHYVPVVCDEIVGRGEFLTAYGGLWYSDHGKNQAYFEFQSLLGELLDMDAVGLTTYDWAAATSSALLMASRLTGRGRVLVPRTLSPDKGAQLQNFARSAVEIVEVGMETGTGLLDLADLRSKLTADTACVYFENPGFLGVLETRGAEIAGLAHDRGALCVVGVDPVSLGVLAPPSAYGADIVTGEVQPLGVHMQYGGGLGGFVATRHDPAWLAEIPSLLTSIMRTEDGTGLGYGWANWVETSWVKREESRDFTGTTTGLWTIAAAVYLSLMGPRGMRELGETIVAKAAYAARLLDAIEGVRSPALAAPVFKEFVVDFTGTGTMVAEVNAGLLERGLIGGWDLSEDFPELGESALFCVTEMHTQDDLDRLAAAVAEVTR